MRESFKLWIKGIPYAKSKSRGRIDGLEEWSYAVAQATEKLPPITSTCRLDVTFCLPADKYPADLPHGPDLDNLLKRFLDALNETLFRNMPGCDSCVTEVCARKRRVSSTAEAGAELLVKLPNHSSSTPSPGRGVPSSSR